MQKGTRQRRLSLILIIAMLVTALPVNTFAESYTSAAAIAGSDSAVTSGAAIDPGNGESTLPGTNSEAPPVTSEAAIRLPQALWSTGPNLEDPLKIDTEASLPGDRLAVRFQSPEQSAWQASDFQLAMSLYAGDTESFKLLTLTETNQYFTFSKTAKAGTWQYVWIKAGESLNSDEAVKAFSYQVETNLKVDSFEIAKYGFNSADGTFSGNPGASIKYQCRLETVGAPTLNEVLASESQVTLDEAGNAMVSLKELKAGMTYNLYAVIYKGDKTATQLFVKNFKMMSLLRAMAAPTSTQSVVTDTGATFFQNIDNLKYDGNNPVLDVPDNDFPLTKDQRMGNTDARHPIDFYIDMTGYSGIWQNAYLAIRAYDVDEEGETGADVNVYGKEVDYPYLNGEKLPKLSGTNNNWNTTVFKVNPIIGKNLVKIMINQEPTGTNPASWALAVGWGQIVLDNGPQNKAGLLALAINNVTKTTSAVTATVDTKVLVKEGNKYNLEVNLLDPNQNNMNTQFLDIDGTGKVGQTISTPVPLSYNLNSPTGTYTINAFLYEYDSTGTMVDKMQAYQNMTFNHEAGVGIVGPKVLNVTSSTANGTYYQGDKVNIQVQYDSSVLVSGWHTNAAAFG